MELQPFQKRTWAEINLDAAVHNYNIIREKLNTDTKLCCVVKANGYGHGAVQLSRLYEQLGADYLAVSNVEEGLQIRKAGIALPILILGYTDPRCAKQLSDNNISQCVFSYEYGKRLSEYAVKFDVAVNIHIKIDTGMIFHISAPIKEIPLKESSGFNSFSKMKPLFILSNLAESWLALLVRVNS